MTSKFRSEMILGILFSTVFFILPVITRGGYVISLLAKLFFFAVLAQSWNLISGYCGYFSLGHQAFFGVGAYTAAILAVRYGCDMLTTVIAGGILAALLAYAIGLVILRVRGPYFVIVTLVLSQVLLVLVLNTPQITGGGVGMTLPPRYLLPQYYYGGLILTLILFCISVRLKTSTFGMAVLSIRENEDAAEMMGVNTVRYKVLTFSISAFFTGLAGALNVWYMTYIDPRTAFSTLLQINVLAMVILGGIGTAVGPLIGAVVFTLLSDFLQFYFTESYLIIIGLTIIFITFLEPAGIIGVINRFYRKVKEG